MQGSVPLTGDETRVGAPAQDWNHDLTPRLASPLPGRFGLYRPISKLGHGGWGKVFLAEDTRHSHLVALKVLDFDPDLHGPDVIARFRGEAQAAAALNHPGLCRVHDAGRVDDQYFLVMDYIEGESLASLLKRDSPLAQDRAVALIRKVAFALVEAHACGVIHRDLKPSNIMIRPNGEPVVIDFGLARLHGTSETRITTTGTVLGSPHYMSPEQVNGDVRAMGPNCDIYSLGVVLYELLTGKVPFDGSLASVLGKILFFEPPAPSTHRADLDPRLEAICLKAMAKEISARYATMGEMAVALESI